MKIGDIEQHSFDYANLPTLGKAMQIEFIVTRLKKSYQIIAYDIPMGVTEIMEVKTYALAKQLISEIVSMRRRVIEMAIQRELGKAE